MDVDGPLLFRMNKSSLGMARIDEAIPWDDCPYAKSNTNTFVRARAYRIFQPRVSGPTLGAPLRAFGTLGVPPQLIPPHSVRKPYTRIIANNGQGKISLVLAGH